MIVDYNMPHLNGAEFVRLLRRSTDSPNRMAPVIMCTAHTSLSIIKELINAGADEVLGKPVSPSQAKEKCLAAVLRRRQLIQERKYAGPDRRRRDEGALRERRGGSNEAKDREMREAYRALMMSGGDKQAAMQLMKRMLAEDAA